MTTINISHAKFNANNADITGTKDKVIGSGNHIHGSYNEAVGDNNFINGGGSTVIGNGNHLDNATNGKLFIYGSDNHITLDSSSHNYQNAEITLSGKNNKIDMEHTRIAHTIVHGYDANGDSGIYAGEGSFSLKYQGGNTLVSFDEFGRKSDMLFTNSHLTSNDVFVGNDSEF